MKQEQGPTTLQRLQFFSEDWKLLTKLYEPKK